MPRSQIARCCAAVDLCDQRVSQLTSEAGTGQHEETPRDSATHVHVHVSGGPASPHVLSDRHRLVDRVRGKATLDVGRHACGFPLRWPVAAHCLRSRIVPLLVYNRLCPDADGHSSCTPSYLMLGRDPVSVVTPQRLVDSRNTEEIVMSGTRRAVQSLPVWTASFVV